MSSYREVRSLDNPLVREIRALQRHPTAYRTVGRIWLEGEHVVQAWRDRFSDTTIAVVIEERAQDTQLREFLGSVGQVVVVPRALFFRFSDMQSPSGLGLLLEVPLGRKIDFDRPSVILDRLQDTGNVGSIIRSAAAFGYTQLIALRDTAALWSPKCLRAAAGAHANLNLIEEQDPEDLRNLRWPLLSTSSHAGASLDTWERGKPANWVFSHEGQGVSEVLRDLSHHQIRIEHTAGQESLNVAAAAAICLYASRLLP